MSAEHRLTAGPDLNNNNCEIMICSFMETERKIYSIFERFSTCAKQELGGKILKPAAVENAYLIVVDSGWRPG